MSWRIDELPSAPRDGDDVAIICADKPLNLVPEIFASGHMVQCGGYACWQRAAYGTYIAISDRSVFDRLYAIFKGNEGDDGITSEQADRIDAAGVEGWATSRDEEDMRDSCEAYVKGTYTGHEAVLCWENSD